jgi:hypothetical protein
VKRIKYISALAVFLILTLALSLWNHHPAFAQNVEIPQLTGFTINEIRFDESMGGKKPLPQIPKSWHFVGVSNGEKENNNNLWFQDAAGNIYMLQGFTDGRNFIMGEGICELHSEN